jgi:phosphatidate cytidylyltransferase
MRFIPRRSSASLQDCSFIIISFSVICYRLSFLRNRSWHLSSCLSALFTSSSFSVKKINISSDKPFLNIASSIFGVIYVVVPFSFLIELGHYRNDYEPNFILGIFFLIWTNDTFAYLTGSLIGKRKLMERISPGKSWEGFLGGGLATLILAWFLKDLLDISHFWKLTRIDWLIIGGIIFIFGTMGDLIESMFKRSTGVKDSGKIMAGHGGVLDRFDSLTLAVPFIYGYLYFVKKNLVHFQTFFGD